MQQLVIKLSPEATQDYLKIAQSNQTGAQQDMAASDIQLDINMAMVAGLCFADIGVNGESINSASDSDDLEVQLIDL